MPLWLDLPLDWTSGIFTAPTLVILAYLDPSTGSYALQILLATLFGGMFALKQSWAELKLRFSARFGETLRSPDPIATRPAPGVRPNDLARPGVHGHQTVKIQ